MTEQNPRECCEGCRYWRAARTSVVDDGFCRRYPPTLLVVPAASLADDGVDIDSLYPRVAAYMWCGEWKKRTTGNA